MRTGKPDWWEDSLDFLKQDEILSEIVKKYRMDILKVEADCLKQPFALLLDNKYL